MLASIFSLNVIQTALEQEAVEKLYRMAKYEYESALRHLERERERKERMQNGQK